MDDEKNLKAAPQKPAEKKERKEKAENGRFERLKKWCVSKFNEYKSEFKKVVWPSKTELFRQSLTVIVVSLIFGAYIAAADGVFGLAFTQFVKLVSP